MLIDYKLIHKQDDVADILAHVEQAQAVSVDLETTGLSYSHDEIHGVAIATENREYYVTHAAKDRILGDLASVLNKHPKVYMHNGVFDLHFLRKYDVRPVNLFDTMIGQWMIDENQELGLKVLGGTKLGYPDLPDFKDLLKYGKKLTKKKTQSQVNIYDLPLHKVAEYAGKDGRLTYMLGQKTEYELNQQELLDLFYSTEMPFLYILLDMEATGFYMDVPFLTNFQAELTERMDEQLNKFQSIAGTEINIDSNDQLANLLYNNLGFSVTRYTDSGAPSVDSLALMRMMKEDTSGVVEAVAEYRKYGKLLGTYVNSFLTNIDIDGRLRARFNQIGTVTGRISSSSPTNLMNIPSRGEYGSQIRKAFIAMMGWDFVDIDYSQLELRLAAHYAKDENLIRTFFENGDPHQLTADLCGVERWVGKTLNFGVLYGSGPRKLCLTVEKTGQEPPTEAVAKDWLRRFDEAYPTIKRWKANVVYYAKQLGYVRTISGRRRRLPDLLAKDFSLVSRAERQAVNSVIQGSAADIIKRAMLDVYPVLMDVGGKLLAQVHDELCFEVPTEAREHFGNEASKIMVASGEFFKLRVPLEAKPGHGPSWGEAKG